MKKLSFYVIRCSLVAALGGLLFGFDTAVISGTTEALQNVYKLSDAWLGFTVASALFGTIIGSICIGWPTDKIGRRNMLVGTGVLYLVSAAGSAFAWDWYSFLIFRFIGGLGVGGASVLAPIYIAEISPAKKRGFLVALAQFNIVLGILLAYVSNYAVALCDLGATEWRWMFGVEIIPAAAFIVLLFGNPYSPRWLMSKKRKDEALDVLCRLEEDDEVAKAEQIAIQESLDLEHHMHNERFYSKKYLMPIFLACAIGAFNQLSGINALIYYGPRIFKMTGAGGGSALVQSAIIGLVNLAFTMAAMKVIDHFGRKKLMLVGSIGYIVSLGVASWVFFSHDTQFTHVNAASAVVGHIQQADSTVDALKILKTGEDTATAAVAETTLTAIEKTGQTADVMEIVKGIEAAAIEDVGSGGMILLAALIVFIASHAFGQGAVVWVFISEIFPNRVRARGQALGAFTLWVFNAIVSQSFPWIAGKFGGGIIFAGYCSFMILQLLWVVFLMPETKGVPLEEIQKRLNIE